MSLNLFIFYHPICLSVSPFLSQRTRLYLCCFFSSVCTNISVYICRCIIISATHWQSESMKESATPSATTPVPSDPLPQYRLRARLQMKDKLKSRVASYELRAKARTVLLANVIRLYTLSLTTALDNLRILNYKYLNCVPDMAVRSIITNHEISE